MRRAFWLCITVVLAAFLLLPMPGLSEDLSTRIQRQQNKVNAKKQHEGVLVVKSPGGTTLVFNDAINNLPKLGGIVGVMLAPTGRPSVPRIFRWVFVKDKKTFVAAMEQLAATPDLKRVIMSHGKMFDERPADDLRAALTAF